MTTTFKRQRMPDEALAIDPTLYAPNQVCDTGSPHWYISYNPESRDYGSRTTALVLGQVEYCIILNGDHRQQLAEILDADGFPRTRLDRCLEYIREHKDQLNKFSDPVI